MNRYKNNRTIQNEFGVRYVSSTIYPDVKQHSTDIIIESKSGDALDIYAHKFYQDSTLWWIIALANNLPSDSMYIESNQLIRIPTKITEILNEFNKLNSE